MKERETYEQPYHWMLSLNYKALYDLRNKIVIDLVKDHQCFRWLDVGCGDGKFVSLLTEISSNIVGIDISERGLRFGKCLVPGAFLCLMDSKKMAFNDLCFDVVSCLDVIEHLSDQELEETIYEIYRVLKEDGILIISVPSKNKPLESKHYRHYNVADIYKLASLYFIPIEIVGCGRYYPFIKHFFNLPIIWRLINKLVIKECPPDNSFTIVAKLIKKSKKV